MIVEPGTPLVSCAHCGIVALDTPRFGWKRWTEYVEKVTTGPRVDVVDGFPRIHLDEIVEKQFTDTVLYHHCPAAVQMNEWIENGMVNMVAPEEAVTYESWEEGDERDTDATILGEGEQARPDV